MSSSPKSFLTFIRPFALITGGISVIIFLSFSIAETSSTAMRPPGELQAQRPTRATPSRAVSRATVTIEAFQFRPNEIVLKKGGRVTFINKDSTPHSATPDPGSKFTGTGRIEFNQSKTVVFNTVGMQTYYCDIHPSMTGRIRVVE